jgi:hypothetical protein
MSILKNTQETYNIGSLQGAEAGADRGYDGLNGSHKARMLEASPAEQVVVIWSLVPIVPLALSLSCPPSAMGWHSTKVLIHQMPALCSLFPASRTMSQISFCSLYITWSTLCLQNTKTGSLFLEVTAPSPMNSNIHILSVQVNYLIRFKENRKISYNEKDKNYPWLT